MRYAWLISLCACLPAVALAAPPPAGSPDADLLAPYADEIKQAMPGDCGRPFKYSDSCCSIADGTVVQARVVDDHWEIHMLNDRFPKMSRDWVRVPDAAVLHCWHNPVGMAMIWVQSDNIIRCFAPPEGV